MKLTSKQQKEVELIKFFIPEMLKDVEISEKDIEKYFELIEEGKHKQETGHHTMKSANETTGYGALLHGLVRRDINITMYANDFNEYREELVKIWVKDQEFPEGITELIIKKLK